MTEGLDNSLAHRKKEITDLQLLCDLVKGKEGGMLRRSGHVLIYAHWEGFVKEAISEYLNYLKSTKQRTLLLKDELKALTLISVLDKPQPQDKGFSRALTVLFESNWRDEDCFDVDIDKLLKVGNIGGKELRFLLNISGLEYLDVYLNRENWISEVLCGRRHRIAHGGLQPIGENDIEEAVNGTIKLCEAIYTQIVEALRNKYYLAVN
ncbi:MAE_28990/MAE_18760 family HEPN-like nuclease [Saccharopolyspora spinosa]|uniref:MAE_28990/MAE_18760 family HEPN-like nuclease n=1 Tax=Saccharopolyspora spinosa TaxID=60894 RepID=UPI00117A3E3C|nr:MAE_28990/MAE_18760 family HEPN-like nuclease [Saccharopolyspora spinosa]